MTDFKKSILFSLFLVFGISDLGNACTIFVLTDQNNTIFFNNEDYSNPNTRIWFLPGDEKNYGVAYVGFDNGWGQGGVNTEGLAFDWFAGGKVNYRPSKELINARQNNSERMLESCATVDEAITYYKTYAEMSFAEATILIADKSGASVIIGARNGKLYFEKSDKNAAIGYGLKTFNRLHGREAMADLTDGTEILQQCVQKGTFATKYSSIYNLKTGEITINQFIDNKETVSFNIYEELEKGGHFYDIPLINQQIEEELKPLLFNQQRLSLYDFDDISIEHPEKVRHIEKLIQSTREGNLSPNLFTEEIWDVIKEEQKTLKEEMKMMGELKSLSLIKKEEVANNYSFIAIYENARVMMQFAFTMEGQIQNIGTAMAEVTNPAAFESKKPASSPYPISDYLWLIGLLILFVASLAFATYRKPSEA